MAHTFAIHIKYNYINEMCMYIIMATYIVLNFIYTTLYALCTYTYIYIILYNIYIYIYIYIYIILFIYIYTIYINIYVHINSVFH